MDFRILIPLFSGLVTWYVISLLADILPHLPLFSPHCSRAGCRAPLPWRAALLLKRCPVCKCSPGLRTWGLFFVFLAASVFIWQVPPDKIGYWGGLLVFAYLTLVGVIDLEHHLILLPLSITGILISIPLGLVVRGWQSTLIGGAAGFSILLVFFLFGKLFTRLRGKMMGEENQEDALGSGDVTLALILGLMLGWPLIWFDIFMGILLSGAVGVLIMLWLLILQKYRKNAFLVFIPLGPGFIIIAFLIIFLPHYLSVLLPR